MHSWNGGMSSRRGRMLCRNGGMRSWRVRMFCRREGCAAVEGGCTPGAARTAGDALPAAGSASPAARGYLPGAARRCLLGAASAAGNALPAPRAGGMRCRGSGAMLSGAAGDIRPGDAFSERPGQLGMRSRSGPGMLQEPRDARVASSGGRHGRAGAPGTPGPVPAARPHRREVGDRQGSSSCNPD